MQEVSPALPYCFFLFVFVIPPPRRQTEKVVWHVKLAEGMMGATPLKVCSYNYSVASYYFMQYPAFELL